MCLNIFLTFVKRGLDTNFTFDPFTTKKKSMLDYKKVYKGGNFQIHIKYTIVMNVTFTAMMYGLSMPILFPLAGLTIYNMRICNRVEVAWLYKLPPAMNDSITRQVMALLKFSPLFLIFNGYWIMDNQQIFNNVWSYKMQAYDHMPSAHQIMFKVNQASPLFYICFASIIILILQFSIPPELLMQLGFSLAKADVSVDEDLPDFFEVVNRGDAKQLLLE